MYRPVKRAAVGMYRPKKGAAVGMKRPVKRASVNMHTQDEVKTPNYNCWTFTLKQYRLLSPRGSRLFLAGLVWNSSGSRSCPHCRCFSYPPPPGRMASLVSRPGNRAESRRVTGAPGPATVPGRGAFLGQGPCGYSFPFKVSNALFQDKIKTSPRQKTQSKPKTKD